MLRQRTRSCWLRPSRRSASWSNPRSNRAPLFGHIQCDRLASPPSERPLHPLPNGCAQSLWRTPRGLLTISLTCGLHRSKEWEFPHGNGGQLDRRGDHLRDGGLLPLILPSPRVRHVPRWPRRLTKAAQKGEKRPLGRSRSESAALGKAPGSRAVPYLVS